MPLSRVETGLSLSRAGTIAGGSTLWKGSCHCGRNRFEVKLPKIESAIQCDCLLCHKSGYLWAFPEARDIKYTKGDDETLAGFETEALSHEVRFQVTPNVTSGMLGDGEVKADTSE